ncbi:two-component system LytT family response regulator [Dokdonella fugitiva]|uniref:Two-component system LytT family response regulator n=1 Tax=Dokdonella fugitiva TaxID=328517 RepID=A0A839F594_9GAMM|nr:LytTR family DNA-binding domain-containing protein [Dokdonella fugitiva]MBA8889736.1 two-component system LytT family response regulator [Dokdonella fugitiva]
MAPLRVLIVDDEAIARRNLALLLGRDPDVGAVVECDSGQAAIDEMRRTKPDLLFLDVQMPECDGFDVLELMGPDMPAAVIFVTAYDEYALRAFDAGALDYLLKPFDDARFARALQRAKSRLALEPAPDRRPVTRLVVKNRGQMLFLDASDVDWIEAANYYACLHVGDVTHILRRSLQTLEGELDANTFVRIHRSIIVNRAKVRALELQGNGEYEVVLHSGDRLPLSRRFRKPFQDRM